MDQRNINLISNLRRIRRNRIILVTIISVLTRKSSMARSQTVRNHLTKTIRVSNQLGY
jgi:hypothetical protein